MNYRKILLYGIEHKYFANGTERATLEMINLSGAKFKTAFAICMDIEYGPEQSEDNYPLAEYYKDKDIDLLVLLFAWSWEPDNLLTLGT